MDRTIGGDQLTALLENSQDIVIVLDDTGTITYVNPAIRQILGHVPEEMIGEYAFELVHPSDREDVVDLFTRTIESPGEVSDRITHRLRHADGDWVWVESVGSNQTATALDGYVINTRDVTERRENERELKRYQVYTGAIFDSFEDGFFVIDANGDLRRWNRTVADVTGYSERELDSMNVAEFVPEEQIALIGQHIQTVLEEGHTRFEADLVSEDGSRTRYEFASSRLEDPEGNTVIAGIGRDVTERTDRERQLRRIRRAIEAAGYAVYITDTDGTIEFVNPAFEEITGYAEEDAIGENPRILKSGEMPDEYYEGLWASLLSGEVWQEELVNRGKDGELYHALQTIAPVENEDGQIEAFVAMQTDVTDQVENRRQLETLISNLPGMVYRCRNERGWPMEFVRGDVEDLVGYSAEKIVGGDVSWGGDVIHPDDREEVWSEVNDRVERDEPFELTYRVRTNAGEEKWVWEHGRVVTRVEDRVPVLEGFIMDVSDRTRLERDLWESLRQLRVIDRVLRHNLRNDMNVIMGYAEIIRTATEGGTARDAALIVEESKRLLTTVEKERNITELLSTPRQLELVDLVSIVRDVASDVQKRHPMADVSVTLPDTAMTHATASIDRALGELVTNAIVHADGGSPTVVISVTTTDDAVTVRVADEGPGIPEMERRILTDEVEIGPLYHGSGLGLWLVALIVQRSDGSLSFEENDPRGSVVTITLPTAGTE